MKITTRTRLGGANLLAVGLALTLVNATALAQRTDTLPVGTVVKVKLDNELSSRTARIGQRFYASVVEGQDDAGLPYGTRFEGVVRDAVRHSGDNPGLLDVDFTRVIFPNEDFRNITGTLASLDAKSVSRSADGRLTSRGTSSSERLKWVGIGAGAGLLVGTLTKNNNVLSTLLGAGLGYLYNETQNKKPGDVTLKAGTQFGVRMERSFAYAPDSYQGYRPGDAYDYRLDEPYANPNRYRRGERPLDDPYYNRSLDPNDSQNRYYRRSTYAGDLRVAVDGREVRFANDKPFVRNGIAMIPFGVLARSAGIGYRYDTAARTIAISRRNVRMNLDDRFALVDGRRARMSARAEVRNGVLYVPMDFAALALDGDATYNGSTGSVEILTRAIQR